MGSGINRIVRATAFMMAACVFATGPDPCFGQVDRETWQPPGTILDAIGPSRG